MNMRSVLLLIAIVSCVYAGAQEALPALDTLTNPSFEELQGGKIAGWMPKTWEGRAKFDRSDIAHEGEHSLTVTSEAGADAGWQGSAVVHPYSTYRFTAWVKTEGVAVTGGKGALINVQGAQPNPTRALVGNQDWTRVESVFETGAHDVLEINCVLGGWGQATGKAWFDGLTLERVSSRELKPVAVIDGAATGAPISPYVYGQFIEHLGRCIYGGIWAEMLEDRKFFEPVGAKESPWRAYLGIQAGNKTGLPGTVEMSKERAYAGEQSACLVLNGTGPFGILQSGLALLAERKYVGRIVLAGDAAAGPVDVTLVFGKGEDKRQTVTITDFGDEYKTFPLAFAPGTEASSAQLIIMGRGKGRIYVGAVSLMPDDNIDGMRADTIALLKQLNSPVYRWPGGNFVSGYDWRNGIGDRDKRPPRKNPAWEGIEHNDFGIDEFMTFCRLVGTEPYITVNSGLGGVEMAVQEVQYANGAADSPMGKQRAANGHAEPYGVTFWAIGNEMYGDWQLGHMALSEYVKKNNTFADAMRAADPNVKLIAVGATGDWSRTMLAEASQHMDYLSEHFYCGSKPGLMSHVRQIPDNVRLKADEHRKYHREIPALSGKLIPIALDEWNYWYGPEIFGQIGTRYFLRDGLGIAAGLHEYFRNSDVFFMANYAQTVNVIGAIKTSKTAAAFETTGLALMLYRREFGVTPIKLEGDTAPLDVAAAWTADRKAVTVGIVNPTLEPRTLALEMRNANLSGAGKCWVITGSDQMAYNDPSKPDVVRIVEQPVSGIQGGLAVPAIGVALYRLEIQ